MAVAKKSNTASEKQDKNAKAQKVGAALKKRPLVIKKKVRHSLKFRRPKTIKPLRNPKCPTKAIPKLCKMDDFQIIKCPLATEAAIKKVEESNTLVFTCHPRANKHQIRTAVQTLYDVKVYSVNTLITPYGMKKAFIRLPADVDAIDVANKIGIL